MTEFERFFDGEFRLLLDTVTDDGSALTGGRSIADASWDRKAAWLLWQALGRAELLPNTITDFEELLG